ncbi:MAG: methyltransferase [Pseudomonadota bacterium]
MCAKAVGAGIENQPSVDAFLNNRFQVYQPTDGGHRAGLDALLLAAAVPAKATGALADFGAGSGVAGLAALVAAPGLVNADLYEVQPASAALARRTCEELLPAGLAARVNIYETDVRSVRGNYTHIICNPPYNDEGHRVSPSAERATAHAINDMKLSDWVEAARKCLAPGGQFSTICRASGLAEVSSALADGFGAVRVLPIHSKVGQPATRIVVTAIKGRRTQLALLPGFVVHGEGGSFTPLADAIFKGEARLPVCLPV